MNTEKNKKIDSDSETEDDDEILSSSDDSDDAGDDEESNDSENDEESVDEENDVKKNKTMDAKNDDKYDENDNCYAKEISIDDDDEINFDNLNDSDEIIKKNGRLTKPILEKYEVVKLLAVRSKQIAQGAKPMIKNYQNMSHKEIAKNELILKILPLVLVRPLPNSESEKWYLRELYYSKIMYMLE